VQPGGLDGFGQGHRWQDRGNPFDEHRFAWAWQPDHEHVGTYSAEEFRDEIPGPGRLAIAGQSTQAMKVARKMINDRFYKAPVFDALESKVEMIQLDLVPPRACVPGAR